MAVTALVIVQALVGAFVVWESLAAVLVGFHYSVSVVIVCVTAAFLVRMYEPGGLRTLAVPRRFAMLATLTAVGMVVIIVTGVFTTAAGPHSGDADVVRDGFDATLLSHLHAWPGYITVGLLLGLVVRAKTKNLRPYRAVTGLLVVVVIQIAVGIYQARNGLPPLAVGVHMVLAAVSAAMTTVTMLRLKRPTAQVAPASAPLTTKTQKRLTAKES
jgi:cytochrome c oxidase assembly protein subunit 15